MPTFSFLCSCGKGWDGYIHNYKDENPKCACGLVPERVWSLGNSQKGSSTYPYISRNITPDGSPVEVTSGAHLESLCKQYNVVHRPDNGWIEKEFLGVDWATGRKQYKEGSGRGVPGCWQ